MTLKKAASRLARFVDLDIDFHYLIDDDAPNAYAAPEIFRRTVIQGGKMKSGSILIGRTLAVTMLKKNNDEQSALLAVSAHELSHIV